MARKAEGAIDSASVGYLKGVGSATFLIEEAKTGSLQPVIMPHAMLGEGTTTALFGTWHITHASLKVTCVLFALHTRNAIALPLPSS